MKKMDANVYKTSDRKEIDCHDIDLYWITSIKDKIQWFPFLTIMEHTANILKTNKGLILSLKLSEDNYDYNIDMKVIEYRIVRWNKSSE